MQGRLHSPRDSFDVDQRHVPHTSFNPTVIRAVKAASFRSFFLIDPLFLAHTPDGTAEADADIERHRLAFSFLAADAYTAYESHFGLTDEGIQVQNSALAAYVEFALVEKGGGTMGTRALLVGFAGLLLFGCNSQESERKAILQGLGPASYVDGPNAASGECKKLDAEWLPMIERQVSEDGEAEKVQNAQTDQVQRSQTPEWQKEVATNNLSAKQDAINSTRENRQKNEEILLRQRELQAGCIVPNK